MYGQEGDAYYASVNVNRDEGLNYYVFRKYNFFNSMTKCATYMYLNTYMVLEICKEGFSAFEAYEDYYYGTDSSKVFVMDFKVFKDFNRIINNQMVIYYYSMKSNEGDINNVVRLRLTDVVIYRLLGSRGNGIVKLYI